MDKKMNVQYYLRQPLIIRERMSFLRERIEKIETDLGYHPLQLDDSGASKASITDKVGDKLAELADLETKYKDELVFLEKKNEEIRRTIQLVQNPEYRAVLTARYITENKKYPCRLNTWVAIAFTLGMTSEEAVKQKHKRAVRDLEKILQSDTP